MLLNPNNLQRQYPDRRSGEIMAATVDFFESRGKARLKHDDHERVWYSEFLDHIGRERIFASLLTPSEYGADDCRWDTYRISEFAEIVGFYGLNYWYPFQVTALGLGPIWMSDNTDAKRKAAAQLEAGEVFAFGLSEQTHGADVYQTDMILTPSEHGWTASGEKYYIGNANVARMVSTFGKIAGSDEYVFFTADSQHDRYDLIKNVVNSQNYVANYALRDYPVTEADILHRGQGAFHAALNTVNVCKYNLGWGAVGMCTHAMYEAVTHASNRVLYGTVVTDFSHVRRLLTDAYVRLIAMKLVATRACDYMRSASADDRRYLLYSPLTKAKITSEGERVITALWDVIAAKGVEKDTIFEAMTREIGLLPRLEGTVHINIGLLAKFMPNYLFAPNGDLPLIGRRDDAVDDSFLFNQGPTGGLGKVRFHDWRAPFESYAHLPNVALLREQIDVLAEMLASATPDAAQQRDIDFAFGVGQLFATVPYAQLILEEAPLSGVDEALIDEIFAVLVRDFNGYAVELADKSATTDAQARFAMRMIRRPVFDHTRYDQVWKEHIQPINGAYQMRP
ncbi:MULTISPECIES: acyl-CoA dehydrogenase family protein [unclassified Mycobacterium]|uniref:acyl-CoA dehydrogenase family protein n=1 Tax=unclassified Mycobacterium TaxID=2642494 RepID=UPI0007FF09DA|nr:MULTISPECIES: acyl-CoA dehydrogenase family protein [unclassified Mycobacterium]OBG53019.1 acyl-CoA dehydrogenase [Mycobacterium sp. E735]OBG64751.1 acyl-CoA dehydrogenase [Mycobacterium sp. E188]OBG82106.1 acyl-CoA dehydrogenase [Mycobacterium sp. E3305]OBG94617.1 acyl-CoA dehydrogenase [Mycobacterium sp. E3298]OBH33336.1 acyl-CoA dehydrogenase [Mycobacterium sp. E183]